jgi:hypothetical protein
MEETFTAIFTLQFYYVDPTLKDFPSKVTYIAEDGCSSEVEGIIFGRWGWDGRSKMLIQCKDSRLELKPTQVIHETSPDWDTGRFQAKWSIMNLAGEAEELFHTRQLLYCSRAGGHIFEKFKYRAVFAERLELRDMPFDKQGFG